MKKYYWHNIGQPYRQSWWDYMRNHSLITTGFQNKEGDQGEKILKRYKKNDFIIAYANKYGALGVLQVIDPESYRLVTKTNISSSFESSHRHWLSVQWLYAVENLGDGVPFKEFHENFGLYFPRRTSQEIKEVDGAKKLIQHLRGRGSIPNLQALPEEITNPSGYIEGASQSITVNAYERNGEARRACIEHYGCKCAVCGFDFQMTYGEIGEGYINVHHIKPLASIKSEYIVNPIADLRPVCPNCHAIIHRSTPPFTIDEVREMLGKGLTRHSN